MQALRRTAASGFSIDKALSLETLKRLGSAEKAFEKMISMSEALKGFPEVVAEGDVEKRIGHGRPLSKQALDPVDAGPEKYVKVVDRDRRLLAILTSCDGKETYDYESVFI